jgi:hypothetical protein
VPEGVDLSVQRASAERERDGGRVKADRSSRAPRRMYTPQRTAAFAIAKAN